MPSDSKSTVEEIRARFDGDVERFSQLETGQSAAMDSPYCLQLMADVCVGLNSDATSLLDLGCGAGNYALKILQAIPTLREIHLVDLSQPMLERAEQRLSEVTPAQKFRYQTDMRDLHFDEATFDLIVTSAALHHLREDREWEGMFAAFHRWLKPGGAVWMYDLFAEELPALEATNRARYSDYLVGLKGEAYRDQVFAYIEKEDTPRSLEFQLDLLRKSGFERVHVLHRHACFGLFGAVKSR